MRVTEQFESLPKRSRLRVLRQVVRDLGAKADDLARQRDAVLRERTQTLQLIAEIENEPTNA